MAKAPEGMEILPVLPYNYDKIIELSKGLPPWSREPYTREELKVMRSQAQSKNSVAMVMFMSPDFWEKRAEQGETSGE